MLRGHHLVPAVSAEGDVMHWKRNLALLALSGLAFATPARASTMEEIYAALKLEDLRAAPSYTAGEIVEPTFSLVNRSTETLVVPLNTDFSQPFHLVGVLQAWIERLGPVKTIPSIPPQTYFDGSRYAAGGTVVPVEDLPGFAWPAGLARSYVWGLNTAGYPDGTYRFFMVYQRLDNSVVESASVDFTVGATAPEDTTAPTLTVPADLFVDATGPDGAVVSWVASAVDDEDPAPVVTCAPPSGSLFPIGTQPVLCTATDASGNSATAGFDVTVQGAAQQLEDLLAQVAGVGPGGSLSAKLRAATARLAAGDGAGACRILGAFLNELRAQAGKSLTLEQAAALAEEASRIRAVLGC
jgi:hypothetical protein